LDLVPLTWGLISIEANIATLGAVYTITISIDPIVEPPERLILSE
jgi:hypothetical protein